MKYWVWIEGTENGKGIEIPNGLTLMRKKDWLCRNKIFRWSDYLKIRVRSAKSVRHTSRKTEYTIQPHTLRRLKKNGVTHYSCCESEKIKAFDHVVTTKSARGQNVRNVYHFKCAKRMNII